MIVLVLVEVMLKFRQIHLLTDLIVQTSESLEFQASSVQLNLRQYPQSPLSTALTVF